MQNTDTSKTGRQYKDTLFRTLFGDSKRFLELYNAVADDNIAGDAIVTPCPTNPLLARFNDLAACIGPQLIVFFEHQSSASTNMPLRLLSYFTDTLYSSIIDKDALYGSAQIKIPTPKFYVLFNGENKHESKVMRLSDAFIMGDADPAIELTAKVVDINYNSGESALDRSASLKGYAFLIAEVRKNLRSGMTRDEAIVAAIELCVENDILKEFLKENYWEVAKMLSFEYDAEAERRVLRQEGRLEGRQEIIDRVTALQNTGMSLEDAFARAMKEVQSSSSQ